MGGVYYVDVPNNPISDIKFQVQIDKFCAIWSILIDFYEVKTNDSVLSSFVKLFKAKLLEILILQMDYRLKICTKYNN